MEISFRYTNAIVHLVYDNQEKADIERNKLLARMERSGGSGTVTILDKFGTTDIIVSDIKCVRCYDILGWEELSTTTAAEYDVKVENKKKLLKGE